MIASGAAPVVGVHYAHRRGICTAATSLPETPGSEAKTLQMQHYLSANVSHILRYFHRMRSEERTECIPEKPGGKLRRFKVSIPDCRR